MSTFISNNLSDLVIIDRTLSPPVRSKVNIPLLLNGNNGFDTTLKGDIENYGNSVGVSVSSQSAKIVDALKPKRRLLNNNKTASNTSPAGTLYFRLSLDDKKNVAYREAIRALNIVETELGLDVTPLPSPTQSRSVGGFGAMTTGFKKKFNFTQLSTTTTNIQTQVEDEIDIQAGSTSTS